MLKLNVLTQQEAPDKSKPLLDKVQADFGFIPNLIGIMAHSPALTQAYLSVADSFTKSDLTPTEQQIVLLTVSYYHKCNYCLAAHTIIAGMLNVNSDIVESIRNNQPITNKKLEALRLFTRQIIDNRGSPSSEEINAFLQAGYHSQHILDILDIQVLAKLQLLLK